MLNLFFFTSCSTTFQKPLVKSKKSLGNQRILQNGKRKLSNF